MALLSTAPSGGVSREKLATYLWPEADEKSARHLLANSVYAVRQELGRDAIRGTGKNLWLDTAQVVCDVREFEDALQRDELERAVGLYCGPFVDGFFLPDAAEFEQWTQAERERIARQYARALEDLADQRESERDFTGAVQWWRQLAAHDPYASRIALRLMQALEASGNPAGALQHARIHEDLLEEALGVEPDPEVSAFAERLRLKSAAARNSVERQNGSTSIRPPQAKAAIPAAGQSILRQDFEPQQGYTQVEGSLPSGSGGTSTASGPAASGVQGRLHILRRLRLWIPALALLVLSAMSGILWRGNEVPERSITVLPFENLGPDSATSEYFADGVTEDVLTHLSRISALRVISHTSATPYQIGEKNLREIARELGASYVIKGRVRRDAERVRVTAQLINARTGEHLWAESYDRDLGDIFAIQSDVAANIARALESHVSPTEKARIAAGPTRDFAAYELYLKGRYFWNRRTASDLAKAIGYFEKAIERDSGFAAAHAGLADSYILLPPYSTVSAQEAYPKAKAAALRAIELDGTLANAYTSLAYAHFWYDWDWKGAERAFRRAIEINPSYPTAHHWYAEYLATMGRFEEAFAESKRAQRLAPLSLAVQTDAGAISLFARQDRAAVDQFQKVLEMDAGFGLARWYLGMAYAQQRKYDAAIAELEKAVQLTGGSDLCRMYLAHTYAISGRRAEALQILTDLTEESRRRKVNPTVFGFISAGLGDTDVAFRWLEQAVEERSIIPHALTMHGQLDPLRSDPRYMRLLRRASLR